MARPQGISYLCERIYQIQAQAIKKREDEVASHPAIKKHEALIKRLKERIEKLHNQHEALIRASKGGLVDALKGSSITVDPDKYSRTGYFVETTDIKEKVTAALDRVHLDGGGAQALIDLKKALGL